MGIFSGINGGIDDGVLVAHGCRNSHNWCRCSGSASSGRRYMERRCSTLIICLFWWNNLFQVHGEIQGRGSVMLTQFYSTHGRCRGSGFVQSESKSAGVSLKALK